MAIVWTTPFVPQGADVDGLLLAPAFKALNLCRLMHVQHHLHPAVILWDHLFIFGHETGILQWDTFMILQVLTHTGR